MSYDIAISRAAAAEPALFWATFWDEAEQLGDWRVAPAADPVNPGGLDATGQLASAVVNSLFTDNRAPEGWRPDVTDRRGWWGARVAPEGEEPEEDGSLLWTLKNEVATPAISERARIYAAEALAWMLRDRVAASVTVEAGLIENPRRGVWLDIQITDRAGELAYSQRFARLWRDLQNEARG
jgi:phage gp46-like protein